MDQIDDLLQQLVTVSVPDDVTERARLLVLDTLGCAIAGFRAAPVGQFVEAAGKVDRGPVALPCLTENSLSAPTAATALAMAACWDEACEGLARAHGRPGVASAAAAVALGVALDKSAGEVLDAFIAGYETSGRFGELLRIRKGMHVDAGWPAFGSAAAAARLLGGGVEGQRGAIELVASQLPFGLYLPVTQGANGRNTYLGHAASLGVHAALWAASGVRAPSGAVLAHGALALGLDSLAPMTGGPDEGTWLLREGYLKRWPAVRHVHYGVAAARAMRRQWAQALTDWPEVRRIQLRVYPEALTYCGNRAPVTAIQAQFSLTFGLAVALLEGDLTVEDYREPRFSNPEMRRIEQSIELVADPSLGVNGTRAAVLHVEDNRGRHFEQRVDAIDGDPDRPLDRSDVIDKWEQMSGPTLGGQRAQRMARSFFDLPTSARWGEWWGQLLRGGE